MVMMMTTIMIKLLALHIHLTLKVTDLLKLPAYRNVELVTSNIYGKSHDQKAS